MKNTNVTGPEINVTPTDSILANWARREGYPFEQFVPDGDARVHTLIMLRHAVACFRDGTLVHVDRLDPARVTSDAARELAVLFAFCGYLSMFHANGIEQELDLRDRAIDAGSTRSAKPRRMTPGPV